MPLLKTWVVTAFEGLALIFRRPASALVWIATAMAAYAFSYLAGFLIMRQLPGAHEAGALPDMRYVSLLGAPVFALIGAAPLGAVFRSVLSPAERSWTGLRYSRREGRVAVLLAVQIAAMLSLGFVPAPGLWKWAVYAVAILVGTPFSLIIPATFAGDRFAIGEGLQLARENVAGLMVMNVVTLALYLAISYGAQNAIQAVWRAMRPQMEISGYGPLTIAVGLAMMVLGGFALLLGVAPSVRAYARLAVRDQPVEDTFT